MFDNTWRYQHNIQTLLLTVRHFGRPVLHVSFDNNRVMLGCGIPPNKICDADYFECCRVNGQNPAIAWPIDASVSATVSHCGQAG
jgi:hypothetical protein